MYAISLSTWLHSERICVVIWFHLETRVLGTTANQVSTSCASENAVLWQLLSFVSMFSVNFLTWCPKNPRSQSVLRKMDVAVFWCHRIDVAATMYKHVILSLSFKPPCVTLRQTIDSGGFYDTQKLFFKGIKDVVFVAACAPPGGGRNSVSPRLLRHFSMIWLTALSSNSLNRIFQVFKTSINKS